MINFKYTSVNTTTTTVSTVYEIYCVHILHCKLQMDVNKLILIMTTLNPPLSKQLYLLPLVNKKFFKFIALFKSYAIWYGHQYSSTQLHSSMSDFYQDSLYRLLQSFQCRCDVRIATFHYIRKEPSLLMFGSVIVLYKPVNWCGAAGHS